MKDLRYSHFSLRRHLAGAAAAIPSACQFEITFNCPLHCGHCRTSCFAGGRELDATAIKSILDKVRDAGALWLCLTGGDPLARHDFAGIYTHAKALGFMVTVLTSGVLIDRSSIGLFRKMPPFVVEITLNAAGERVYEEMSGVQGSWRKAMAGIRALRQNSVPLKLKTLLTSQNQGELPKIRELARSLGVAHEMSADINPRLNGDTGPCGLRAPVPRVRRLHGAERCRPRVDAARGELFRCAAPGMDTLFIDASGDLVFCPFIRRFHASLLDMTIPAAQAFVLSGLRATIGAERSVCASCSRRGFCTWCPGRALLEKGDMASPIAYYCATAGRTDGAGA